MKHSKRSPACGIGNGGNDEEALRKEQMLQMDREMWKFAQELRRPLYMWSRRSGPWCAYCEQRAREGVLVRVSRALYVRAHHINSSSLPREGGFYTVSPAGLVWLALRAGQ